MQNQKREPLYFIFYFTQNTLKDMESKVRKTARIRNRYNQVHHLSQDTNWESNKITIKWINNTNKSQEVSPFPSGDHKAAKNRRKSMTNTNDINNTNDPQKKYRYRLGTVSKYILLEGLNRFHGAPTSPLVQMWIKTHQYRMWPPHSAATHTRHLSGILIH